MKTMTEEEKALEAYDIEHNPDADLVGGSISIAVCDMGFPDKKDVKRWLEALERRKDQDNENIQIAIEDCKYYLGYVD
jgi:disulfide oxidoreductase YuzD